VSTIKINGLAVSLKSSANEKANETLRSPPLFGVCCCVVGRHRECRRLFIVLA